MTEALLNGFTSNDILTVTLNNIEAISLPTHLSPDDYIIGIESSRNYNY